MKPRPRSTVLRPKMCAIPLFSSILALVTTGLLLFVKLVLKSRSGHDISKWFRKFDTESHGALFYVFSSKWSLDRGVECWSEARVEEKEELGAFPDTELLRMLGSVVRWVRASVWCPLHWARALPRPGHVTPALRRGAQPRPAATSSTHHQKLWRNECRMIWSRSFCHSFYYSSKWGLAWNLNNLYKSILFRLQPPLLVMISSQQQPQPLALSPLHFGRLPPMMMAIALLSYIYSHTNTATASKISTNRCYFSTFLHFLHFST